MIYSSSYVWAEYKYQDAFKFLKAETLFLIVGIGLIISSIFIENITISSIIAVVGFSSLWSIHEIIEQEERVKKGWFPKNPNKKDSSLN